MKACPTTLWAYSPAQMKLAIGSREILRAAFERTLVLHPEWEPFTQQEVVK